MDMLPHLTSITTALDRTIDILATAIDLVAALKNLVVIGIKIYDLFYAQWQRQWGSRRYLGRRGHLWWQVGGLDGRTAMAIARGRCKYPIPSLFRIHVANIHVKWQLVIWQWHGNIRNRF
jgi:hypothetical protein